ncbi:GNAT family N-acetyltransferase [Brachybacterium squillarum]|uniref:GNAT family N-acetyltransferase n=1 Tax=Brachybacterium squillarum TaxID=661979 RepID=UPI0022227EA4|nr:GNAT family N-acetyltransferase [Brachybacterium squillarum]MCW1805708.1 GNAT family N-acetyltransferase [Brachybacterium squillarum]
MASHRTRPVVREALPDDLPAIGEALRAYLSRTEEEKRAHGLSSSTGTDDALPERYRAEVEDPARALAGCRVLVAELEAAAGPGGRTSADGGEVTAGAIIGIAVLAPREGSLEIKRLWASPSVRGRGVGSALLDAAIEAAGPLPVTLTVWDWRERAIGLYRSRGFALVPGWDERPRLLCLRRSPAVGDPSPAAESPSAGSPSAGSAARITALPPIRPARPEDAAALTALHLDAWDEAYTGLIASEVLAARRADPESRAQRWRENIATTPNTVLVAEGTGERLLGFAIAGAGRDEPAGGLPERELMALYVRAEVYGTGLGHALLRAAIGDGPASLWVLEGNARAIRFYERQGFRFDGARKEDPVGAELRMVRGVG